MSPQHCVHLLERCEPGGCLDSQLGRRLVGRGLPFRHLDHLTLQNQTSLGRRGSGVERCFPASWGVSLPELPPTVCSKASSVLLVLGSQWQETDSSEVWS